MPSDPCAYTSEVSSVHVNIPLAAAAGLAVISGAVHLYLGQKRIFSKLESESLPPMPPMGGPAVTRNLLRGVWFLSGISWIVLGGGLVPCLGSPLSDGCRAVGRLVSVSFGIFALFVFFGLLVRSPRLVIRHPGWPAFTAIAVLAWIGVS